MTVAAESGRRADIMRDDVTACAVRLQKRAVCMGATYCLVFCVMCGRGLPRASCPGAGWGAVPVGPGCANRPVTADAGGGAVGAVAVVSLCRMARGEVGDEGQLQLHARKSTRFDMLYSAFSGVPRARIAASVERAIDGRESDNKSERRVGSLRLFGLAELQRNRGFVCFGSRAERTLGPYQQGFLEVQVLSTLGRAATTSHARRT